MKSLEDQIADDTRTLVNGLLGLDDAEFIGLETPNDLKDTLLPTLKDLASDLNRKLRWRNIERLDAEEAAKAAGHAHLGVAGKAAGAA